MSPEKIAKGAEVGGSGMAASSYGAHYFGMSTDEWTLIFGAIGVAVGIAGFVVTWVYKQRHYRIALKAANLSGDE